MREDVLTSKGWVEPIELANKPHGHRSEVLGEMKVGVSLRCPALEGLLRSLGEPLRCEGIWQSILVRSHSQPR